MTEPTSASLTQPVSPFAPEPEPVPPPSPDAVGEGAAAVSSPLPPGRPGDALALLRECQDRVLEREGIPMVLALVSEVGEEPAPGPGARADGERIAASLDELWRALAPTGRDGDMGRVTTALQAASYADFGQGRSRL